MAGPWEQYGAAEAPAGPWAAYAPDDEGFLAKLGKAAKNVYNNPSLLAETLPGKIVKSAVSAAALPGDVMAGKTAAGGEEAIGRAAETAMLFSPVKPGVSAAAETATRAAVPTQRELLEAGSSGYKAAREMGVEIAPAAVKSKAEEIAIALNRDGVDAELAPKTFSVIKKLANPPEGAVSANISNIESARRAFGHAAKDFTNPTERLASSRAIEHLDDYLATLPPSDLIAGDAAAASKVLGEARGNYAAAKRSEQITDKLETGDLNAAAANSGRNVGNAQRQQIKSILNNDRLRAGYSADEIAQMERLVRGTKPGNAARIIGNLLGGGGGLGSVAAASAGAAATGPVGAFAPVVGAGIKHLENMSVARQARILDEMVRRRSPMAGPQGTAASSSVPNLPYSAIVSALLHQQQGAQ
jgi:hypothetical protein